MTKKLRPWLVGLLAATLFMALLNAFTPFHYTGSDDTPILRSFMGYEGGVPAHFHLYLHTAFAWLLHGLALLFPGIAWFSILQLFLLWLSSAVIVKSCVSCTQNHRFPWWAGALAGIVFLATYGIFITCRISYTTTCAWLGAAAVFQLLGVDYRQGTCGSILRGIVLSIVLLLCCYCLRQIGVLPPLAFWMLALLLLWVTHCMPWHKKTDSQTQAVKHVASAKPLLLGALICALSFGLFAGIRAIEIKILRQEDFLAWQKARIQLLDYTRFDENTSPETLEEVGWSPAEFKLVTLWYFMDENITTEAFDTLYAAQPEASLTVGQKLERIPALLKDFWRSNPGYVFSSILLLGLLLLCLLAQTPGGRPWRWLFALGGVLLGLVLLLYLSYQGRLPMRAGVSVIFPAAAFLLCLTFISLEPSPTSPSWRRVPLAFLCAATVTLAGFAIAQNLRDVTPFYDPELEVRASIPADLDAYALENPDVLFVYDLSLVRDQRLFPDASAGIPGNTMFWGGYPSRSPSWMHQLSVYGFDGASFSGKDFLRDNILVAGTDGEPSGSLVTYVGEDADADVDWDFYDEYGYLYFYQLYE